MIRHIVAFDQKQGIAKGGVQPWYIPDDEAYFQTQTKKYSGKVLMGARTFEAIKHPLPERENFVLTHHPVPIPGVIVIDDLQEFLHDLQGDLWIIGGAEVFSQTLYAAGELYITKIEADFHCDRFYPNYTDAFTLASQSELKTENGFNYRYEVYRRK